MMDSIEVIEGQIVAEFDRLETVDEKYAYLFRLGEQLAPMAAALKTEQNQVKGCQSTLWFYLDRRDGRYYLLADSDSMVMKGIAALLARVIAGQPAEAICTLELDFLDALGIWRLPSERNNGLVAMLDHLKRQVSERD